MKNSTYYLTTAIPYANASPHIGFALEILYADVAARYQRLLGQEVYFITGTDEHGQKMLKTAKEAGQTVENFASERSAEFQNLADQWNITNTDFIRTTEPRHVERAKKFWEAVFKNGDIYKKKYNGLYCVGCESYKTEKDLINGVCPYHPNPPSTIITLEEENYFFRLSRYQEPLQFLFESRPDFVFPESRHKEMYNILKSGLEDISISRSREKLSWGIPVPGDDSQVMYVWFDALTNYITALGYGSKDSSLLKKFWPATHIVGKDINRFHALLWPAMLLAAGLEPPKQIAVHGWIMVDGQKMSKSLGNVINPLDIIQKYPLDAVRYFFLREIPFESDGNFSEKQFSERYNGDLANGIGNLTNRILTMVEKYSQGAIPAVHTANSGLINFLTKEVWTAYQTGMTGWRFDQALAAVWKFVAYCDQLISDKQPWALAKAGKTEEVYDLLYHLSEALRHIAVMIWPVMPETAEKIFGQLGLEVEKELSQSLADLQQWVDLTVGNKIDKGQPLFPRI